jgi:hypothetical protein
VRKFRRRYTYAVAYLFMAAGGFSAAFWPAPSVQQSLANAWPWLIYVWDSFLFVGGLLCAAGAVSDRWIGEYMGLPLLASVFGVYGVSAAHIGITLHRPESAAGAFALTAIALLLHGRWREISGLRSDLSAARG